MKLCHSDKEDMRLNLGDHEPRLRCSSWNKGIKHSAYRTRDHNLQHQTSHSCIQVLHSNSTHNPSSFVYQYGTITLKLNDIACLWHQMNAVLKYSKRYLIICKSMCKEETRFRNFSQRQKNSIEATHKRTHIILE